MEKRSRTFSKVSGISFLLAAGCLLLALVREWRAMFLEDPSLAASLRVPVINLFALFVLATILIAFLYLLAIPATMGILMLQAKTHLGFIVPLALYLSLELFTAGSCQKEGLFAEAVSSALQAAAMAMLVALVWVVCRPGTPAGRRFVSLGWPGPAALYLAGAIVRHVCLCGAPTSPEGLGTMLLDLALGYPSSFLDSFIPPATMFVGILFACLWMRSLPPRPPRGVTADDGQRRGPTRPTLPGSAPTAPVSVRTTPPRPEAPTEITHG